MEDRNEIMEIREKMIRQFNINWLLELIKYQIRSSARSGYLQETTIDIEDIKYREITMTRVLHNLPKTI